MTPVRTAPGDHIDTLVAEVLDLQFLVDRVGLDEGQPPRRQRRTDGRDGDQDRLAVERHARHDKSLGGGSPVGVGEHPGDHVGDEDRAEREQDVLDVAEGPAQDQQRDADRRERHADVAADAAEQLAAGRDTGELGAEGASVGDHQGAEDERRRARAIALANQGEQALAGDDAQPHPELVEDDQRRGREGEHPEQLVAVLGAEDRVGGDPGRIVVGEPRQQARADHRQQRRQAARPQQPVATAGQVAAGGAVGEVLWHGQAHTPDLTSFQFRWRRARRCWRRVKRRSARLPWAGTMPIWRATSRLS